MRTASTRTTAASLLAALSLASCGGQSNPATQASNPVSTPKPTVSPAPSAAAPSPSATITLSELSQSTGDGRRSTRCGDLYMSDNDKEGGVTSARDWRVIDPVALTLPAGWTERSTQDSTYGLGKLNFCAVGADGKGLLVQQRLMTRKGEGLESSSLNGVLLVVRDQTGTELWRTELGGLPAIPAGAHLIVPLGNGDHAALVAETGKQVVAKLPSSDGPSRPTWVTGSLDGKTLLFTVGAGQASLYNISTGKMIEGLADMGGATPVPGAYVLEKEIRDSATGALLYAVSRDVFAQITNVQYVENDGHQIVLVEYEDGSSVNGVVAYDLTDRKRLWDTSDRVKDTVFLQAAGHGLAILSRQIRRETLVDNGGREYFAVDLLTAGPATMPGGASAEGAPRLEVMAATDAGWVVRDGGDQEVVPAAVK